MQPNALVPRATVAQICAGRDRALALYGEAYAALSAASEALKDAASELRKAAPLRPNGYNHHSHDKQSPFIGFLDVAARDDFMAEARKMVDTDVWAHIVEITDLERLMDKKAKDELRQQLLTTPPEATVDNVFATLQGFMLSADDIFRRGIAECFSKLDRRFRSHDGWKIGSRVILTSAFDEWGHWNYHRNHRDTLTDIERVFLVMDGKKLPPTGLSYGIGAAQDDGKEPPYIRIVDAIDNARGRGFTARQTEVVADYFTVRVFKNGNAHVWFKRDDLLQKVNKLLGEYYGAAIPEEREPDEDTGLHTPKTGLAKNYGFFPTPDAAARDVVEGSPIRSREGPLTVLEPSAGTGSLSRLCLEAGAIVDCIEIHHERAAALSRDRRYRRVLEADFLAIQPDPNRLYDRVVCNPPFDRERDIDHVMHALKFLNPNGHLTAIMSAGTEFRETKKSAAFRALMETMKATWRDLPPGSFASVGTNVNTVVLRVWKDGRQHW